MLKTVKNVKKHFRSFLYIFLYSNMIFGLSLIFATFSQTIHLLKETTNSSIGQIGISFSTNGVANVIFCLLSGYLLDLTVYLPKKKNLKWTEKFYNPHTVLLFIMGFQIVSIIALPFVNNYVIVVIFQTMLGSFQAAMTGGIWLCSRIVKKNVKSSAMQIFIFSFGVGQYAMSLISGYIIDSDLTTKSKLALVYWGVLLSYNLFNFLLLILVKPPDDINVKKDLETRERSFELKTIENPQKEKTIVTNNNTEEEDIDSNRKLKEEEKHLVNLSENKKEKRMKKKKKHHKKKKMIRKNIKIEIEIIFSNVRNRIKKEDEINEKEKLQVDSETFLNQKEVSSNEDDKEKKKKKKICSFIAKKLNSKSLIIMFVGFFAFFFTGCYMGTFSQILFTFILEKNIMDELAASYFLSVYHLSGIFGRFFTFIGTVDYKKFQIKGAFFLVLSIYVVLVSSILFLFGHKVFILNWILVFFIGYNAPSMANMMLISLVDFEFNPSAFLQSFLISGMSAGFTIPSLVLKLMELDTDWFLYFLIITSVLFFVFVHFFLILIIFLKRKEVKRILFISLFGCMIKNKKYVKI